MAASCFRRATVPGLGRLATARGRLFDAEASFALMRGGVKTLLDQSATRRSIVASATLGLSPPARPPRGSIDWGLRGPFFA